MTLVVGALVSRTGPNTSAFIGSCFSIGGRHTCTADHNITAAHERDQLDLHVIAPGIDMAPVVAIFRHPLAAHDLAVLRLSPNIDAPAVAVANAGGEPVTVTGIAPGASDADGYIQRSVETSIEAVVIAGRSRQFVLADAPGPGFSGSAVVDEAGDLVGVYTGHDAGDVGRATALVDVLPWLNVVTATP